MLYEAYYPSEFSDKHPVKIFYGFAQADNAKNYELTLVVFYPHLTGTSLFNLSHEIKEGLAYQLLSKHIYDVPVSFLKVAFLCPHISGENQFYGECWSVDVFENYAEEYFEEHSKGLLNKIFKTAPTQVSMNTRELVIGFMDRIKLLDEKHIDTETASLLLHKLKQSDFGDFKSVFGDNT